MPECMVDIWRGDQLDRREEATLLERFLIEEVDALEAHSREHSYVLALDAQYGEGKTWFLERFTRQLQINHPVAFVDAWIDDANDEPLVAIMSAIEEALAAFEKSESKVMGHFKAATRAALPIIGKVAVGALTKAGQKWLGDQIGDQVTDEFVKAKNGTEKPKEEAGALEEGVVEGLGKGGEAVASLVDKRAELMLAAYRDRKASRQAFKDNMRKLVASINPSEVELQSPLFIVVDELDRCRPSYAIKLLEEIKHFFDVPGVVFVIALHGSQLTKSISAVYGAEFDSAAYLQRFFTRRYELRRLPVVELVQFLFEHWEYDEKRFEYPAIRLPSIEAFTPSVARFAGEFLNEFQITPRQCFVIVDAVRIFYKQWGKTTPIELPWLLANVIQQVTNRSGVGHDMPASRRRLDFAVPYQRGHPAQYAKAADFIVSYWKALTTALPDVQSSLQDMGSEGYLRYRMEREFVVEHQGQHRHDDKPYSVLREYAAMLNEVARFKLPSAGS